MLPNYITTRVRKVLLLLSEIIVCLVFFMYLGFGQELFVLLCFVFMFSKFTRLA